MVGRAIIFVVVTAVVYLLLGLEEAVTLGEVTRAIIAVAIGLAAAASPKYLGKILDIWHHLT